MRFEPRVEGEWDRLRQREWLETDGLGNFALGTVSGIHARRYHGLLIAGAQPGGPRRLLCSKLEETVFVHGGRRELSANQYQDTIYPQGYLDLVEFRLDPWPTWTWRVQDTLVEKQVLMLRGRVVTVVAYRTLETDAPVGLELRPLIAGRDFHGVQTENWHFRRTALWSARRLSLEPYDAASQVNLHFSDGHLEAEGYWYHGFVYARERERCLEDTEDLFCPGTVAATLRPGVPLFVAIAPHALESFDGARELQAERDRRAAVIAGDDDGPTLRRLVFSAEAFRIERDGRPTVQAGYPWFEPRLRDALIAMPGLTVCCGLPAEARRMVKTACRAIEAGDPADYGEGDAPLWLAWCAERLRRLTGELLVPDALRAALEALVRRVQQGEQPRLRLDSDGLVACADGAPGTWMNAVTDGVAITPRQGKPVETNALWYASLRLLAELAGDDHPAGRRAERVLSVFRDRFWSDARGWLADVVDGPDGDDPTLRPNQLFAVAVDDRLLPEALAARIVGACAPLLTPFGPRTLLPGDARYRGEHAGDWRMRDEAYHNGCAWPWLVGVWADCLLRLEPSAHDTVASLLQPFEAQLGEHGLGHLSELHGGDPPHRPSGTIAHAVSAAELLRVRRLVRKVSAAEPPISAPREAVT